MTCPSDRPMRILVIDDEPGIHRVLTLFLQSDFSVHTALSGEEGLDKVNAISPDLVMLDLVMPRMSGMEVLRELMQNGKNIPVIVFTGYGTIDSAVRAIKLGAVDYIEKPFDCEKLKLIICEILNGRQSYGKLLNHRDIVGKSPQIQQVWQLVGKYGPTDLPILLQGETGTGKELFARAIHEISRRKHESFVPVDCSTIPETLFESEIFGYEKGAFTGASTNKPGHLDWAHKGTFFLDEIANLSLVFQAKLLRIIQERQYIPLGARAVKEIDVRFISSSNVDLREAIEHGGFREDLYYRICGVCIELPPLREREGDVELLARYFADKYARRYNVPALEISDEAMELLFSYPWPGNVRQLEHTIGAAVASANRVVLIEHLPADLQRGRFVPKGDGCGKVKFEMGFSWDVTQPIDLKGVKKRVAVEAERVIITEVKKKTSFSQIELARFFGLDPKTLRARIRAIR